MNKTAAAFVIVLTISLMSGCKGQSSPTDPAAESIQSCGTGCDGVLHIPPADQVQQTMVAMRDQIRAAVADGSLTARKKPDWDALPQPEWKACWFVVNNASWVNSSGQQVTGKNCAAGLTDFSARKIVISTWEQSRTLALVRWETANYFLLAIGRSDLTDSWQGAH